MSRIVTKIGDVFEVKLNNENKKYFQYIAQDQLQLNSDVIRAFEKEYKIDEIPKLSEIINDNVQFYVHCVTKLGIKMKLWKRIGNIPEIGNISHIVFRDTTDYGYKEEENAIQKSNNWYIWKLGDKKFREIGELKDRFKKSYIGIVINPLGVIELLKGKKYPPYYPEL